MPNTPKTPKYRIGDFSHFTGVSPDFLKHYEEHGLLKVQVSESGYRYYTFEQAARIIEYLRLKNYGVSVKEMNALLQHSPDGAFDILNAKAEQLEEQIEHMQAVVDEQRRLYTWYQARREHPLEWEITQTEPYLFLFHSRHKDFIKDPEIYAILNDWLAWLPVVKSALYLCARDETPTYDLYWGLGVPETIAMRYRLPMSSAVKRLEFGKAFTFHFFNIEAAFTISMIEQGNHPGFNQLKKLGFPRAKDGLLINDLRLSSAEGVARYAMGRLILSLTD